MVMISFDSHYGFETHYKLRRWWYHLAAIWDALQIKKLTIWNFDGIESSSINYSKHNQASNDSNEIKYFLNFVRHVSNPSSAAPKLLQIKEGTQEEMWNMTKDLRFTEKLKWKSWSFKFGFLHKKYVRPVSF